MKARYLLIDFENVQPRSLAALHGHSFKVKLFVGASQTKIPLELARELQTLGHDADYVQISGNGRNALDFHIAYTLGELSAQHSDAAFLVVSKDTGFDPLIKHMKARNIRVQRIKDIADIPVLHEAKNKTIAEKVKVVVANLNSRGTGRPRKVRTLKSTINALFGKTLSETELSELVKSLEKGRYITIDKESVSYQLQGAA